MARPEGEQPKTLQARVDSAPVLRQVQGKRIEADFTLSAMIGHFLTLATEALAQGKIREADYAELVRLSQEMMALLERIGERELLADAARKRARLRGARSPT